MAKILVIEDDTYVRSNLLTLLEVENYECHGAENGLIGLQKVRELNPDLIICDVMMPELDGYEVLKNLRADTKIASIPFIFLSAKADKQAIDFAMKLGANDYVTKPFTRKELLSAIKAQIG
ncbi:MAG TPA: response regulator [Chloroflexia bacterium]|nr:response regulator [Chloroflexia bacterium]